MKKRTTEYISVLEKEVVMKWTMREPTISMVRHVDVVDELKIELKTARERIADLEHTIRLLTNKLGNGNGLN